MPSLFSRLRPGPGLCPRWLCGRPPRRLRLPPPPPPPDGLPGPAFIVLSSCCVRVAEFYRFPGSPPRRWIPTLSGKAPPITQNRNCAVAGDDWTHFGTNPNSLKELLFENEIYLFDSVFS